MSVMIAGASLALWLLVAHSQDAPMPDTTPEMAQQIRINSFRIMVLERRIQEMDEAHDRIMWMLVGNLAAAIGALVTYTVTHIRRRPDGEP